MSGERRNYYRLNFESNIVAIGFGLVGKVTDISPNGIGVKYNRRIYQILRNINDLQIFKIDESGFMDQIEITAKIISDICLHDKKTVYFHNRCGFQFVEFTKDQLFKLEHFLDRQLNES